ncbi:response regulator [Candidatus Venteria ishoeyi]|uniref:histidine kinase n=1 Tax=Candidatus Venteria ishoeyi TaxID=1899563 RepID=A0A1H6FBJ8_9GAMM|nr:response regulator [Candidatus Venteria ishoeyi]SEH07457.1 Autoinducer 2 sensor kinase/phosphatase LuxQ [Candidatus Venteria ishoeyi]
MHSFKNLKLGTQLMFIATAVIILTIASISSYVGIQIYRLAEKDMETIARETALHHANDLKAQLEVALDEARALANVFEAAANIDGFRLTRRKANVILRYFIENNPQFLGVYTAFEKDAYDGKDHNFIGELGHDDSGRFIPYWTRGTEGQGVLEALLYYDKPGDGDYYLKPKQRKRETVIGPFVYPVQGKDILLTSLVVPLLDKNDQFIGISGIDLSLTKLQDIAEHIQIGDFEGAYVHFFSGNGVVAASKNTDYVGKKVNEVTQSQLFTEKILSNEPFLIDRMSSWRGESVITYGAPVEIGFTGQKWMVTVNIPKAALMAHVNETLMNIVGIGMLILVLAWLVIYLMSRVLSKNLHKAVNALDSISRGDLNIKIETTPAQDEVGQLLNAMQTTQSNLHEIIGEISLVTQKLAQGQLDARIEKNFPGQFATIKDAINRMTITLQALIAETQTVSWQFAEGALSSRVKSEFPGDFAEIKHAANAMADNLQALISEAGQTFSHLAGGEMSVRIDSEFPGDFAKIKQATNEMAENLQAIISETSRILAELASGNMQAKVELEYSGDFAEIRHALENTAGKLSQATEQNAIQDWLKTGQAQLNEQLRGEQDVIVLAEKLLNYLAPYLEAQVGLFYLLTEEENPSNARLKLVASYAYIHRKGMVNEFKIGEALVGQAALERKPILMSQIPDDYIHIQSGSGNAVPHTILAIPFSYENELKGVIELGSFSDFSNLQMEFLTQVVPSIGIAVMSAESRTRMQALLDQSQAQAQELQERAAELQRQKAEMQESNEKLTSQAEELQAQSEELQTQQEELRQTNELLEHRTHSLEVQQTEVERKNNELERAKSSIQVKAEELEIASKYKSEFLANMSHELRTPLNSLLILAQLLATDKENNLSEKQLEYANTIHNAGADLLALINDILDLSKVEAGKVDVHLEEISLNKIVDSVEQKFRHMADEKSLEFAVRVEDVLPLAINTDFQRLTQILNNLLGNAFKFTSEGEVSLNIGKPGADTLLNRENLDPERTLSFAVSDSGIGIPEEKQKHIFEAFQQADGTTSRRYGGTGLGLSISRELAQLLGGEIQLFSEEGSGSRFVIYLPLRLQQKIAENITKPPKIQAKTEAKTKPEPRATPKKSQGFALVLDDREQIQAEDKTLLIIEDDLNFGKTLIDLAREQSFKCLYAADGEQGLELAQHYEPAAVILDIGLPKIDGWSVMERLKSNLDTRHIPVHFVSGSDYSQDARMMGAIGYSMKPVSMIDLTETFGQISRFIANSIRNLLIITDDAEHEHAILALLQSEGIHSIISPDCEDARQQLASKPIDCIVLDVDVENGAGIGQLNALFQDTNPVPVVAYGERQLNEKEQNLLQKYATNLTVKEAHSPERLLDEATLFLHQVNANLPEAQKQMLYQVYDTNAVFSDKKMLVVDDDMRNIFALSSALEDSGVEVFTAITGKKGLSELEKHPDVNAILMDIMMPEMDGYEAIRAIRAQPEFRNIPIIALTAKAMKGDKAKCIEAGASDYLSKPVEAERLLSLLRVWLHR